jgi:4-amino-4-deoxy-L-arabinose transferase-like glycosyltransferase
LIVLSESKSFSNSRVVVVALLLLIAIQLFLFDESSHPFAGFEYWKHGDFGRNPEHPPLVKIIATIPLLTLHLREPGVVPIPFFKVQDFVDGSQFLYAANADTLLLRGRCMIALFTLGLALTLFAAAREMFGRSVALIALALFAVEPVILANDALITTDMPLSLCNTSCSSLTYIQTNRKLLLYYRQNRKQILTLR